MSTVRPESQLRDVKQFEYHDSSIFYKEEIYTALVLQERIDRTHHTHTHFWAKVPHEIIMCTRMNTLQRSIFQDSHFLFNNLKLDLMSRL